MRKAVFIMMACLLAGWSAAAAVRVDNFNSYTPGAVETVTTAWKGLAANSTIEADPADPANQVLRGIQQGAQNSTYAILSPETSIAEGQTKTLFFRFRVNSNTTDTAVGMTDIDVPNTADGQWAIFGPDIRFTNGKLDIRHGNTWYTDTGVTLNVGETQPWYNIWLVITNAVGASQATDVFKVYLHQNGDAGATEANRLTVNGGTVNTFGFRVAVAATLDRFLWGRQGGGDATDVRRVWIDDMYVMNGEDLSNPAGVIGAHNPTPANGATDVLTTATLSWYAGMDPANPANPNPAITKHYISFRKGDPNLAYPVHTTLAEVNAAGATGSWAPPTTGSNAMATDGIYYWRVDEGVNNSSRTEPNTIRGSTWRFDAVKSIPVVVTQPKDTVTVVGDTAVFTVKATVSGTLHYQWYYSADAAIGGDLPRGADANSLSISPVARADEGYYYCTIVKENNEDNPVNTNVVKLGAGRKLAHWTLNQSDYSGGQYLDTNLEDPVHHNADPNGTPDFNVIGANGTPNSAVVIDPVNGYASAGTWNPSEMTNQFTVSLWAKWAGQTNPTTWQGLVSKENSYGSGNMMWQLEVVSAAEASSTVELKNGLETGNLSTPVLPIGTWEHIAVTFNGTTATIYRNGVSAASGTWTMGTKIDAPVNIGISARSLTEKLMFNGALDDVGIYNYALTRNEVIDLYHAETNKNVCISKPTYDLDNDCVVKMSDFVILAANWLSNGLYSNP